MIVAGEASGDQRAAEVVQAVRSRFPRVSFFGIGGDEMRRAGVDTRIDVRDLAVMGFVEVIKHLPHLFAIMRQTKQMLLESKPDLLVLVDYPGFNLRLAKFAKSKGVKVLFYISPQVWAWREGRVKKIAQAIDHMAVVFPFELEFYKKHGVPATYVGHPLVKRMSRAPSKEEARKQLGLTPETTVIAFFPGSRRSVLGSLMPALVEAARAIEEKDRGRHKLVFVIAPASTIDPEEVRNYVRNSKQNFLISKDGSMQVMAAADVVVTASGTTTLETALMLRPMVVIYKVSRLTAALARRLIKIPNIALCNVVAGKRIVPELLQDDVNPESISREVLKYLDDPKYTSDTIQSLEATKVLLGQVDTGAEMIKLIQSMCQKID